MNEGLCRPTCDGRSHKERRFPFAGDGVVVRLCWPPSFLRLQVAACRSDSHDVCIWVGGCSTYLRERYSQTGPAGRLESKSKSIRIRNWSSVDPLLCTTACPLIWICVNHIYGILPSAGLERSSGVSYMVLVVTGRTRKCTRGT
jgi:hypothetical protein